MNDNIIENTIEFVKTLFENEVSGHDFFHTFRVYKTSVMLAKKENADIKITAISALLHDVDDRKLSPETFESKEKARHFLNSQGVDEKDTERIISIIDDVSFKGTDSVAPDTIEGKCVQDADRLDALGAIGIARAFAYGGSRGRKMYDPDIKPNENMNAEQYYGNENSTSLNHFYEKLFLIKDMMNTAYAKEIAEHRDSFMHEFIDEFLKENESL